MATKKELYAKLVDETNKLCDELQLKDKVRLGFLAILDEHVAPKAAGMPIDIDSVTLKDEAGKITHIKCQLSGAYLPATTDFFYEEKSGNGIEGLDGKKLRRLSKQAEKARKDFEKKVKATDKALKEDLFEGRITAAEYKEKFEMVTKAGADYSTVSAPVPTETTDAPAA
ncbi:MAG: hypothetical protein AB7D38_12095 [Sulfurimonas sp.]|uniref:hypothetical protein n=1 Tax=Sulfurimonas sp. TaxID=2022749 RepID=UPI003D0BEE92